jgi:hypothetical protein
MTREIPLDMRPQRASILVGTRSIAFIAIVVTCIIALIGCAQTPEAQPTAAAQEDAVTMPEYVAARDAIDDNYRQQIGRVLARIDRPAAAARSAAINCEFQCDAYTARQPVLMLRWQDPSLGASEAAPQYQDESKIRLDISGTPNGFAEGDFGTIQLSNIAEMNEVMPSPTFPPKGVRGQLLLNLVENGRVIERPPNLPLFESASASAMANAIPTLPPDLKEAIQRDFSAGSLSQIRVLGRTAIMWRGSSHQAVMMSGFQPGLTYRVRMVQQEGSGGEALVEQVCRVPVCPADEVNERQ